MIYLIVWNDEYSLPCAALTMYRNILRAPSIAKAYHKKTMYNCNWKTVQGTEANLGANYFLCLLLTVNKASFLMTAVFLSAYLLWTAFTLIYSFPSRNSWESNLTALGNNYCSHWAEPFMPPSRSPANYKWAAFFRSGTQLCA